MKIKLITIPRLRLKKLQTVGKMTINICKPFTELGPEVGNVENSFEAFKVGMQKDQASAEEKRALDIKRDRFIGGFMRAVSGENEYPQEDKLIKKTLASLDKVVKKYGTKIIRLPRPEETSAIDNLLDEIAGIDITPLAIAGIPRWIPVIKAANEEYRQAAKEYLSDSTETDATESASDLAPALEEDLNELFAMMYATIKRTPTDAMKKAYAELEKLIDSMK